MNPKANSISNSHRFRFETMMDYEATGWNKNGYEINNVPRFHDIASYDVYHFASPQSRKNFFLSLIIPFDKPWCEIGIAVYRVGVGMYHSSLVVDDLEWHFWEGYGVEPIPRYFDDVQNANVSIDHVPFVTYVPIDTIMVSPREVAEMCEDLGGSLFSQYTYDILSCNCNNFTDAMLAKLGYVSRMPKWINRLAFTADALCDRFPFLRHWIDSLLNRSNIINRDISSSYLREKRQPTKCIGSSALGNHFSSFE